VLKLCFSFHFKPDSGGFLNLEFFQNSRFRQIAGADLNNKAETGFSTPKQIADGDVQKKAETKFQRLFQTKVKAFLVANSFAMIR